MSSHYSFSKFLKWGSVTPDTLRGRRVSEAVWCGRLAWVKRVFATKLSASLMSILVAALMTSGCGGSSSSPSSTPTAPGIGTVYTVIGDTPLCDVLGFSLFVTEVDLHPQGSSAGTKVTLFPTNSSPTSPVVEFGTLRDTSTIANLGTINAGTYDQAILTLTVDSAAKYDPTVNPPASPLTANITTTNVTVNLQPPLTVTGGQVSVLELDFNLAQSLAVDSEGQLTGSVTPVFSARPITASGPNGFGEFDSLEGFVTTVSSQSPGTGFTSSFTLQTLSGRGPNLTVDLTSNTVLNGVSRIDQMPTGCFVELDAYIDSNGNIVAKGIQVEDREDITQNMLAYLGPVLTVKKDPNGNVTQFAMLVRNTEPDDSSDISLDSNVVVNVSSSTGFHAYSLSPDLTVLANSGNLAFNDQTLAPGQEVVVHGIFTKPSGGLVNVAANDVYLRLQPVQGNFSSLIKVGIDDKTGGFQFVPCSDLLKGTPYIVVTDAKTQFVNTPGLTTLNSATPLLVRGLMFLDAQGGSVNGISVPAGTMVLLANHVRQF